MDGLIARAWLPLPFDQQDIRAQKQWMVYHIDGDPLNCRAVNLEWVPNFGANDPVERQAKINAWREGNRFDASAAVARIFSEAA
ncbi:HNH endonuclease [Mycobacteroides chelonae]|nr:HNH endonuclease [Mycobacteroides chelonae]